jgi:hypothetical protein
MVDAVLAAKAAQLTDRAAESRLEPEPGGLGRHVSRPRQSIGASW